MEENDKDGDFKSSELMQEQAEVKPIETESISDSMRFNLLFFSYQIIRITEKIIKEHLNDEQTVCVHQGTNRFAFTPKDRGYATGRVLNCVDRLNEGDGSL